MSLEVNGENKKYKNPSAPRYIGGILVANAASSAVGIPGKIINPKLTAQMAKISDGLSKDEFARLQKGIVQAFDKTNLKSKGVEILRATSDNIDTVSETIKANTNVGLAKFLPKKIKDMLSSILGSVMSNGTNACYVDQAKKIILPETKLNLAFFHEAGHALNANMSVIGKALQKSRSLSMLMIPIALIALFKNKKAPGEKPKNGVDKATTFIKDNAGKLAFLTFVPTLLEEGMATLKGNKLAKEVLSKDMAKKVAKTNAMGFATYAILAAGAALSVYVTKKIKDAIASRKEVTPDKKEEVKKA